MSMQTAVQFPVGGRPLVDFALPPRVAKTLKPVAVANDEQSIDPPAKATAFIASWTPPGVGQSASRSSKRSVVGLLVLVGHALAFYVLANLPPQETEIATGPMQVALLTESAQNEALPPPPPPRLQEFDIPVEPLIIDIEVADSKAITVTAQQDVAPVAPAQVGEPKLVTSVEYVREPATKYPPAARALKQRGTVLLRVLIGPDGQAREVNVHRSSGYRLLDDAARTAVLNALFKPYQENGRALPAYVLVPIEFTAAHS